MNEVVPKPAPAKAAAPARATTWSAKNVLRFALSLAVSVGCLYFVFRHVDFPMMMEQVKKADHRYTALFAIATAVIQVCRIYRWDILIRPFARISKRALFRISSVGFLLILALPLRLGEFARPYMLKREAGVSMTSGLGSIVVERVVDGLLVVLLFFVTTFYLDSRYTIPTAVKTSGFVAFAIFGGAALVIVTALLTHGWVPRLIARIGNPISEKITTKLLQMLESFIIGLRSLPNVRALAAVVAWTLVYWAINGLGLYWMMRAFGWDVPVAAGFMLVSIVVVGIMIPAGPGFLGTFHAAILAGLSIFGIGETGAAAYGLVVYPITVGVTCAFGLPYLFAGRGTHMASAIIEESNLEVVEPAQPI